MSKHRMALFPGFLAAAKIRENCAASSPQPFAGKPAPVFPSSVVSSFQQVAMALLGITQLNPTEAILARLRLSALIHAPKRAGDLCESDFSLIMLALFPCGLSPLPT